MPRSFSSHHAVSEQDTGDTSGSLILSRFIQCVLLGTSSQQKHCPLGRTEEQEHMHYPSAADSGPWNSNMGVAWVLVIKTAVVFP